MGKYWVILYPSWLYMNPDCQCSSDIFSPHQWWGMYKCTNPLYSYKGELSFSRRSGFKYQHHYYLALCHLRGFLWIKFWAGNFLTKNGGSLDPEEQTPCDPAGQSGLPANARRRLRVILRILMDWHWFLLFLCVVDVKSHRSKSNFMPVGVWPVSWFLYLCTLEEMYLGYE